MRYRGFRLRIREQLCLLIAITALLALMVLAVTTWVEAHHYIKQVRLASLTDSANLKADQIAQDIGLYRDLVQAVSTRDTIQAYLGQYNNGKDTEDLERGLTRELTNALAGGIDDTLLLQAAVFPKNNHTDKSGAALANATGEDALGTIELPTSYPNGTKVFLGDPGSGYPRSLYPNFTWSTETGNVTYVSYENRKLYYNGTLLLGPLYLDTKSALLSMTVAVNNNTSRTDVLGWLTVVVDARLLYDVASTAVGLGKTGEVLVVSAYVPDYPDGNLFNQPVRGRSASENENLLVNFILPPASNATLEDRHSKRANDTGKPFLMGDFPCVLEAWSNENGEINNAGSTLSTHNEQGSHISCGYARVQSDLVDWVVVLEESRGEVMRPINDLRNAILICVFCVLGAVIVICFPLAHYAVKPIQALRTATENSIMTYEADVIKETESSQSDPESLKHHETVVTNGVPFSEKRSRKKTRVVARRQFQIPQKVPDKKHVVHDELTDLTSTFNEMTDELKVQYDRLEDRVKTRTAQLEHSRDLARAADESKTLFIANVSHELRTPLNGIIGMCAVAMQEDEVRRIRQSLNIIYKSSDLLLHLLNDLLTFSRNSYGQQLSIEEGLFRLVDVGTQLVSIFEKQARESEVGLKVVFIGPNDPRQNFDDAPEDAIHAKRDIGGMLKRVKTNVLARGPGDTGPLRDMSLRGDKNRILQVLMNLVSNSLKFTPAGGMIEVRIKCKGFATAFASNISTDIESAASTAVTPSSSTPLTKDLSPATPARQLDFDFEVEDTGPGVPEHLQKEIFKPFVQGDLALSRKHGGTGLGLAICAQLATLMGGGINLKSTMDIGSTFTLATPLGYSKERVPSLSGSLDPGGSRRNSVRPHSMTSGMEVLSMRSARPPTRGGNRTQPPSAKVSVYSGHEQSPQMDLPRIVGFSQPYLTDGRDDADADESPGNAEITAKQKADNNRNRLESIVSVQDSTEGNGQSKDKGLTPNATASTKPKPSPPPPPQLKILAAEDNKVNQQVIMRMLKLEKLTDTTLAEDGKQALDIIRASMTEAPDGSKSSPYDLIFMDIQMPNMDGIESTKHIRELGFDAPIVALTAFDHETNREACREAGMNEFLGKPLKRSALKNILKEFTSSTEPAQVDKG